MNTLTVWRLPTPAGAEQALAQIEPLVRSAGVRVDDAVLVAWPRGRRTPITRELGSITGAGTLWGGFWGMLLGLIFLTPLAGPTFGAAAGAVAGGLGDFGIDDDFVLRVRSTVTPGSSALFILSPRACARVLAARLDGPDVVTLRCELTLEEAQHLQDALADR